MDGPIAIGKTANFLATGSYHLAQCVEPVRRGNKMVRESLWFCIRESENGAVSTMREVIEDALFSPELMVDPNGPYKEHGQNPKLITIAHELSDGTHLKMTFECHGFNNAQSETRLRSRAALGIIIPEVQGIPKEIVAVARQRAGRWRTKETRLSKVIDGKLYTLSGAAKLKIVLADANIPARPHPLYDLVYDDPEQGAPIWLRIPPLPPILPTPINTVDQSLIDSGKYPCTTYQKEEVIWLPNPKAYHMTKHWEEAQLDEFGAPVVDENDVVQTIPWSGYAQWYQEVNQSDSVVKRNVMGQPDTVGGEAAIYQEFDEEKLVAVKPFSPDVQIFMGYDPGMDAGYGLIQPQPDGSFHIFKEIIFESVDRLMGETQIEDFVVPIVNKLNPTKQVHVIADHAALVDTSKGLGEATVLRKNGFKVIPCKVMNQDVKARQDCFGYYLKQGLVTIDPSCTVLIKAVKGGYQNKMSRSGVVSNSVLKNKYSHIMEALQYPFVNFYKDTFSNNARKPRMTVGKIRSS